MLYSGYTDPFVMVFQTNNDKVAGLKFKITYFFPKIIIFISVFDSFPCTIVNKIRIYGISKYYIVFLFMLFWNWRHIKEFSHQFEAI